MPGKKLLVADDSLTIQKVIRLALSNEGYEIQAVSDGNDAVQQISLFQPAVVLIDVSLPGKTAFEVKREINQHSDLEEVRFVLMSSAFEKVDEPQAADVVFHGRLTKPFDPAHLRQVLTEVLAQVSARRSEKTTLLQRPAQTSVPDSETPLKLEGKIEAPQSSFEVDSAPPFPPPPASFPFQSPRDLLLTDDMGHSDDEPSFSEASLPPPRSETPPLEMGSLPPSPPPPSFPSSSGDQWNEVIEPQLPIFNEPPHQSLEHLWDPGSDAPTPPSIGASGPSFTVDIPPPPSPPLAPPSEPEHEPEQDIRQLTESTMRITGMEDYQWSVNEPLMKPLPNMLDRGGSSFDLHQFEDSPQQLPPLPSLGGFDSPSPPPGPPPLRSVKLPPPPAPPPPIVAQEPENQAPPVTSEQIEALVRLEVQSALEKLARQILPEVAERVIKQEIHRLLSE